VLDHVATLSPQGEEDADTDALAGAMTALARAAADTEPAALEDEYHELFIGLGRGEVVPYGSWYLTGFLMEQPLSDLRDDLARLGFARNDDIAEPEDHISAIFEVISVMISDVFSLSEQQQFYQTHMLPWIGKFFVDLEKARSARFYQAVARFGAAFNELEKQYLSMRS
jgi:TorA maturation chaperone TorD